MSNYTDVRDFIDRREKRIAVEYDDNSTYSRMQQQAYMVGVLESTVVTVLNFIEVRYGEQAAKEAMKRALIIE